MRSINVSRQIPSAPAEIGAVLADFPKQRDVEHGCREVVRDVRQHRRRRQRHCDLATFGELEETVKEAYTSHDYQHRLCEETAHRPR